MEGIWCCVGFEASDDCFCGFFWEVSVRDFSFIRAEERVEQGVHFGHTGHFDARDASVIEFSAALSCPSSLCSSFDAFDGKFPRNRKPAMKPRMRNSHGRIVILLNKSGTLRLRSMGCPVFF